MEKSIEKMKKKRQRMELSPRLSTNMNSVSITAFPSLSRTNLSHKKDVANVPFVPRKPYINLNPTTIIADTTVLSSKESWMITCERIQSGQQPFQPEFFWGFKAPSIFSTYEKEFLGQKTNAHSIKDFSDWLNTHTYEVVDSPIDEEEGMEYDNDIVVRTIIEKPDHKLRILGIKESHIEPLLAYLSFVCK